MLVSDQRWALLHEATSALEPDIETLLRHMSPVDLVLVEGFRDLAVPAIEVFRSSQGRPALWPTSRRVIAVASDEPVLCDRVRLDLDNVVDIAKFILTSMRDSGAARRVCERTTRQRTSLLVGKRSTDFR